jgi:hypothetical protein
LLLFFLSVCSLTRTSFYFHPFMLFYARREYIASYSMRKIRITRRRRNEKMKASVSVYIQLIHGKHNQMWSLFDGKFHTLLYFTTQAWMDGRTNVLFAVISRNAHNSLYSANDGNDDDDNDWWWNLIWNTQSWKKN